MKSLHAVRLRNCLDEAPVHVGQGKAEFMIVEICRETLLWWPYRKDLENGDG